MSRAVDPLPAAKKTISDEEWETQVAHAREVCAEFELPDTVAEVIRGDTREEVRANAVAWLETVERSWPEDARRAIDRERRRADDAEAKLHGLREVSTGDLWRWLLDQVRRTLALLRSRC